MEQASKHFWIAVIAGFIVMIGFAIISVNIMKFIPLASPFLGGLVAGLIVGKDYLTGGKAAIFAGVLGAVIVSFDFIMNTGYFQGAMLPVAELGGLIVLISVIIYYPILAFIGGVIGGVLRSRS
jgi:hypothetical protein